MLPAIEKILEEVVVRRLTDFLNKYKIIDIAQYGFQKGKSINKLLGNFANHINTCLSNNNHCLVLYIDFSKAFDTLSHEKLIQTLEKIGIRGNLLKWFQDYLSLRKYRVKVNNTSSDGMISQFGVPQGSKLGPTLYIIYANEMLRCLNNSTVFAYADDTAIVVNNKNLNIATQTMQTQLDLATKWCHDHGLIINATKTKIMHIKPKHLINSNIKIKFHNYECLHQQCINYHNFQEKCTTEIEVVQSYKYLGVYVDSSFKWKIHIENVRKKLRKSAYMLYHLSNCSTYSVLRQAYFSLAESYLRHGITAWGNATYCKTLQKSQNQILKILWKNHRFASNTTPINNNNNLTNSDNYYRYNSNQQNYNNYDYCNTSTLQSNTTNTYYPNFNTHYNTYTESTSNNTRTTQNITTYNGNNSDIHNLAKNLRILNIKSIYYTKTSTDFFNNASLLNEIDHRYNTRRRAQGRYKVERFSNEYGSNSQAITLPTIDLCI